MIGFMNSAGFVVVAVVEAALGVAHLAGGDDAGDFPVGGESEEKVAVGDGAAEGIIAGCPVLAVVVWQEAKGKRILEDFLKLPGLMWRRSKGASIRLRSIREMLRN